MRRRESCDFLSLSVLFDAAKTSATLSSSEIHRRNKVLNEQFASRGLYSENVIGDGNCLFRAISYSLHNHENKHFILRQSVVHYLRCVDNVLPGVKVDITNKSIIQHLKEMEKDGS